MLLKIRQAATQCTLNHEQPREEALKLDLGVWAAYCPNIR